MSSTPAFYATAVADTLLQRADAYLAAAIETIYLQGLHLDDTPAGFELARVDACSALPRL